MVGIWKCCWYRGLSEDEPPKVSINTSTSLPHQQVGTHHSTLRQSIIGTEFINHQHSRSECICEPLSLSPTLFIPLSLHFPSISLTHHLLLLPRSTPNQPTSRIRHAPSSITYTLRSLARRIRNPRGSLSNRIP